MKHLFRNAVAAAALACIVPAASADVLTFDDLSGFNFFTSNYRGFTFGTNNIQTTAWFYTPVYNSDYLAHSGNMFVATDAALYPTPPNNVTYEPTQAISNTTPFVFNGAWFSGDGVTIGYQLLLGNTIVANVGAAPALVGATPRYVASNYLGLVTSVIVYGDQGYYAMDDFTYNALPVPEPESYALMLAGLAGIGYVARRRRQA